MSIIIDISISSKYLFFIFKHLRFKFLTHLKNEYMHHFKTGNSATNSGNPLCIHIVDQFLAVFFASVFIGKITLKKLIIKIDKYQKYNKFAKCCYLCLPDLGHLHH